MQWCTCSMKPALWEEKTDLCEIYQQKLMTKHLNLCLESWATFFLLWISSFLSMYYFSNKKAIHIKTKQKSDNQTNRKTNPIPHSLFSTQGAKVYRASSTILFFLSFFLSTIIFEQTLLTISQPQLVFHTSICYSSRR